ncbi:MAG: SRPBCC domain-containing protein [Acidobacteria bacterium]|jgi:uncharacterized protein YndB with AHSA1/START domain|nr:SRPBCC domain-containing protein [Acidobacteriota bacterium]
MGERSDSRTGVERRSDRELVITRTFDAPVRIVFDAWTRPELFVRWWAPKSTGVPMIACDMDVRTGGGYRIAFGHDAATAMEFFGKYLDVVPNVRLVWTNDESGDAAMTTVTFEDLGNKTRVVLSETYPSKEALDEAFIGMEGTMPEQFLQLDALLLSLGTSGEC